MTTPDLMTPGQVAALFGVDPHTVTRWANAGRLTAVRTPGGHRRYRRADVEALATPGEDLTETPSAPAPHRDALALGTRPHGRGRGGGRVSAHTDPTPTARAVHGHLRQTLARSEAEEIVAALAAAGLLADPTARTEVEWGVACPLDDDVIPTADPDWSVRHHDRNCGPGHRLVRRTVTDWTPAEEDDR